MRAYINNVSNTNSLREYLNKVIPVLKKEIKLYFKKQDDKIIKIKLSEAINSMNKFCGISNKSKIVKDTAILQTMRYMELLKELKKSANKNKKTL